jgi:predicted branched-subunit amino acid permease
MPPDAEPAAEPAPHPLAGATPAAAFLAGMRATPLIPGLILVSAVAGFGALARAAGATLGEAVFITATVFALPGQLVLIEELSRGASISVAAIGVALSSVRLLPMVVVIAPYLRGSPLPRFLEYVASHWVAVTLWVEGMRLLPSLPTEARLPYFLGSAVVLWAAATITTGLGYVASGSLPGVVSAALMFLMPIYFMTSLMGAARGSRLDLVALGIGLLAGPLLFRLIPGFDLLVTGLAGGTIAWLIGRRRRR